MNKKVITLLAAGQPSTNPRLLKEAICLYDAGYTVNVLFSFWAAWADDPDRAIITEYPGINWIQIGGHPKYQRTKYLISTLLFKIFRSLSILIPFKYFSMHALNRTSFSLYFQTEQIQSDLYIAHNLGVLPAAINAARKNKAKVGVDFEDFYSGQWDVNTKEFYEYQRFENRFIPEIDFCTAASPLIAEKYKKLFHFITPVVINNAFSKKYLQMGLRPFDFGDTIKLFWFSQTVGKGRGIEDVIIAIGKLNKNVSLSILGSCTSILKTELLNLAIDFGVNETQIIFLNPVSPAEIFQIAAQHHVGLSLESEDTMNRDICLTNKTFTYLLSGLAIIATDTSAQKLFLETHNGIGVYFPKGNVRELAEIILEYQNNPDILQQQRSNALKLARQKLNWEEESKLFLSLIKQQLS